VAKKAKVTAAAKTATVHRLAHPSRQQLEHQVMVLQREITSSKHSDSKSKSKATKKSSKHTRKWSPDEDVALCSARAVAETWRIASGRPVSDSAVLDLYWSAASEADAGTSILDALEAAQEFRFPGSLSAQRGLIKARTSGPTRAGELLILGLDLPYGEPHAVVAHDGAWWSWGEPYAPYDPDWFPGAVIDEAWAVTWS
jgi:hypothetical protein